MQAKKLRERRHKNRRGYPPPLQKPNNPEPMTAGTNSPSLLDGTDLQAAMLKAVQEATSLTESVSEQGEVGESAGGGKEEGD